MKTYLLTATVLAAGVLLSPMHAGANQLQSKHRTIKNGVGNCIFSADPLPFGKEGKFKELKKSFIAEKVSKVYARCYFPETLGQLSKHGKLFNSLRDQKKWFAWFKMGGFGGEMQRNVKFTYKAKKAGTGQQYFWFCDGKNCDLKKDMRRKVLFEYKLRAKAGKAKLPYKKKFCVQVLYSTADRYKSLVRKDLDIKNRPIAEGCFEYVLTKGE